MVVVKDSRLTGPGGRRWREKQKGEESENRAKSNDDSTDLGQNVQCSSRVKQNRDSTEWNGSRCAALQVHSSYRNAAAELRASHVLETLWDGSGIGGGEIIGLESVCRRRYAGM